MSATISVTDCKNSIRSCNALSLAPGAQEGVALANQDIGQGSKDPRRQCNAPTKYPVGAFA
jgi:hypothetical protein